MTGSPPSVAIPRKEEKLALRSRKRIVIAAPRTGSVVIRRKLTTRIAQEMRQKSSTEKPAFFAT